VGLKPDSLNDPMQSSAGHRGYQEVEMHEITIKTWSNLFRKNDYLNGRSKSTFAE